MKIHLNILTIVIIVLMSLAGCAAPAAQPPPTRLLPTQAPPTQPPATQIPPTKLPVGQETPQHKLNAEVVQKMVDQLNAGDVEGSLAFFTDDARIYLYGFPPTGFEFYRGKDQIRAFWQDMVNNHFQWEVNITSAWGDEVNLQAKTWHDFTRQIGVAPLEYNEVYQVIDGKITSYGSWLTNDSLARFKPAFAAAMPPEPTATPVSGPGVSEMTVTIAGGVCTTDNPVALKVGEVTVNVNVEDQDKTGYGVGLFNLDPNKDLLDLTVALYGMLPPWSDFLLEVYPGPGQSETYTFTLEKGPVYLICLSKYPDIIIGNAGPIPVVAAAPTPTPPARGENDLMLTFANNKCSYEGPPVIPTGTVNVIMNMQELDKYKLANVVVFFTLDPDYDLKDLIDALYMPSPPAWAHEIRKMEAYPGEVKMHEFTVEAGPLYYVCLSGESEETSKLVGKGGPLEVSP